MGRKRKDGEEVGEESGFSLVLESIGKFGLKIVGDLVSLGRF